MNYIIAFLLIISSINITSAQNKNSACENNHANNKLLLTACFESQTFDFDMAKYMATNLLGGSCFKLETNKNMVPQDYNKSYFFTHKADDNYTSGITVSACKIDENLIIYICFDVYKSSDSVEVGVYYKTNGELFVVKQQQLKRERYYNGKNVYLEKVNVLSDVIENENIRLDKISLTFENKYIIRVIELNNYKLYNLN